jgi:hypothetical protein
MSLGLDRWNVNPELPYQLRDTIVPNAARFLTVGRGIAATPMAGPPTDYRLGVPYGALTETEGRALVQELRARKVEMVKIWVDDRLKTVPKLQVNVYEAIIDEAHKNSMRVVAHIFHLEDGKQLLSGIDGFDTSARPRRRRRSEAPQHPKSGWDRTCRSLSPKRRPRSRGSARAAPSQIKRMRDELAPAAAAVNRTVRTQCRNLKKVRDAGMMTGHGNAISDGARMSSWPTWCLAG